MTKIELITILLFKVLICLFVGLITGCSFDASILNQEQKFASQSPTPTPTPTNPFVVKYNNKATYTNSTKPSYEITGINNITHFIADATYGSCKANQSWITYDSNTRFNISNKNQETKYFLKVKKTDLSETDCYEQTVVHDDQIPNLLSNLSFQTFPAMLGLNISPEIIFTSASDSLSGVQSVESKLVDWETKNDLTSWELTNNSGATVTLPSPMASGTFYEVWIRVTDKAGNIRIIQKPEVFVDQIQVTLLTSPHIESCATSGSPHFFDFDRDGDFDIMIESTSLSTACVFENIENKYYTINKYLFGSNFYSKVISIDLDSDGLIDIITQDEISGYITAHYGNLNSSFDSINLITTAGNVLSNVTDINSDGKKDILYSNGSNNYYLKQTSDRIFSNENISIPLNWGIAKPVKLNSDNFTDYYVGISGGAVQFLLNSGDNTNYSAVTVNINIAGENSAMPFDYNADGLIDILHINSASTTHRVSINQGNNTFSVVTFSLTGLTSVYYIVDLNQDGYDDFISTSNGSVYLNNSGSGFTLMNQMSPSVTVKCDGPISENPCGFGAIDFDLDGDLDLMATQFYFQTFRFSHIQIAENIANTSFKNSWSSLPITDWNNDVLIADLNNDSINEILFQSEDHDLMYLLVKSSGVHRMKNFRTLSMNESTHVTDRNNDGTKDIIVGYTGSGNAIDFFNQTTDLSFTKSTLAKSGSLTGLAQGNASKLDNYPDILISTSTPNNLILYTNTTGTSYSPPITIHSGMSSYGAGVALGDINNDTHPDIIVSTVNGKIYQYLNNGSDNFPGTGTEIVSSNSGDGILIEDFDSNGFKDILTIYHVGSPAPIYIHYQTSLGVFSSELVSQASRISSRGSAVMGYCDYDLDGDKDILLVDNGNLKVMLKDNLGHFTSSSTIARVRSLFQSIACGNIDSDPANEIIVSDSNKVYVIDR